MVSRLGKFGTTIYLRELVSEWVSEWSFAYQSPHKNFLASFGYHKLIKELCEQTREMTHDFLDYV